MRLNGPSNRGGTMTGIAFLARLHNKLDYGWLFLSGYSVYCEKLWECEIGNLSRRLERIPTGNIHRHE